MGVKMYLPENGGGFGFSGESFKVKSSNGQRYVVVPDEAVEAAITHGLTQDPAPTDEAVEPEPVVAVDPVVDAPIQG